MIVRKIHGMAFANGDACFKSGHRNRASNLSMLMACIWYQIDRMEAEEAAERRRQQVEAANRMLFSQNDRVQALHSRLLLSEILVERQRQIEHAAGIRALEAANEQDWLLRQAAALKVRLANPHRHQLHYLHISQPFTKLDGLARQSK